MTRDEILNTPAGDGMDALIAEKVMGWFLDKRGIYRDDPDDNSISGVGWSDGSDWDIEAFSPSNDIAAAWEVHKMACSWIFSKRNAYLRHLQECVSIGREFAIAWPDVLVFLDPLAICRAALLTVMEEE